MRIVIQYCYVTEVKILKHWYYGLFPSSLLGEQVCLHDSVLIMVVGRGANGEIKRLDW